MSSDHSRRHKDSGSGGRRGDGYSYDSARRPSIADYGRMPSIHEGVPSQPMSIPKSKSKSRHDNWVESPRDGLDSAYGSISSELYRTPSNTSSGRRYSDSSYGGSDRRPSIASFDDEEDRRDYSGRHSGSDSAHSYGRRDSYGSPPRIQDSFSMPVNKLDDRRDIDGIYGASRGESRHPKETSFNSYESARHHRHDETGGLYGWPMEGGHRSKHKYLDTGIVPGRHRR